MNRSRIVLVVAAVAALAASIAALLASCSREDAAEVVRYARPSVLLFTLDTVRADRMSCYGHDRPTTPNLDRVAAEGVRFTNAYSQSSFTPPSHASILTSRYVSSHGVKWWNYKLPEEVVTGPEVYRDNGYRTACFTPLALASGNGLGQGFNRVVEMKDHGDWRRKLDEKNDYWIAPASAVNEKLVGWLNGVGEDPFFAWVHYYDAHRPFAAFAPERHFCADKQNTFGNDTTGDYMLGPEERAARGIGEAEVRYLKDRYDSGLYALDQEIGRLLATLEASGVLARSIVIFTSDHGEAFDEFEEEWFTHDPFLNDVVTHVPLIVRFPDGRFAGRVVDSLVELIDVVPTLLDYSGLATRPCMQGQSLRPAIEEQRQVREFAWAEKQAEDVDPARPERTFRPEDVLRLESMRLPAWRVVRRPDFGSIRLFDRAAELHEWTDLYGRDARRDASLQQLLDAHKKNVELCQPDVDIRNLSPEEREGLRQAGYLGG